MRVKEVPSGERLRCSVQVSWCQSRRIYCKRTRQLKIPGLAGVSSLLHVRAHQRGTVMFSPWVSVPGKLACSTKLRVSDRVLPRDRSSQGICTNCRAHWSCFVRFFEPRCCEYSWLRFHLCLAHTEVNLVILRTDVHGLWTGCSVYS